ncbi:AbgT family transporter [Staphylococcus aureus]
MINVSVKHPGTHQTIYIKNIISHDGFTMIMNDTIKNFSEFPALGLVLAVMIGIGVAEKTGYFDKLMISVVNRAPRFLILPTIILIGILKVVQPAMLRQLSCRRSQRCFLLKLAIILSLD